MNKQRIIASLLLLGIWTLDSGKAFAMLYTSMQQDTALAPQKEGTPASSERFLTSSSPRLEVQLDGSVQGPGSALIAYGAPTRGEMFAHDVTLEPKEEKKEMDMHQGVKDAGNITRGEVELSLPTYLLDLRSLGLRTTPSHPLIPRGRFPLNTLADRIAKAQERASNASLGIDLSFNYIGDQALQIVKFSINSVSNLLPLFFVDLSGNPLTQVSAPTLLDSWKGSPYISIVDTPLAKGCTEGVVISSRFALESLAAKIRKIWPNEMRFARHTIFLSPAQVETLYTTFTKPPEWGHLTAEVKEFWTTVYEIHNQYYNGVLPRVESYGSAMLRMALNTMRQDPIDNALSSDYTRPALVRAFRKIIQEEVFKQETLGKYQNFAQQALNESSKACALGAEFLLGSTVLRSNHKKAALLLEYALAIAKPGAERGRVFYYQALQHYQGLGIPQDLEKAVALFTSAQKAGDVEAALMLEELSLDEPTGEASGPLSDFSNLKSAVLGPDGEKVSAAEGTG